MPAMPSVIKKYFREIIKHTRFLWVALVILAAAMLIENRGLGGPGHGINTGQVSRKLERIKDMMLKDLDFIVNVLSKNDFELLLRDHDLFLEEVALKREYSVFVFHRDSLVFWSDNSMPVSVNYNSNSFRDGLFYLSNTWSLCDTVNLIDYKLVGVIPLQRDYPYENDYLSNDFMVGNRVSARSVVVDSPVPGSVAITSEEGSELFYLLPGDYEDVISNDELASIILYVLFIVLVLLLLRDLLLLGIKLQKTNWWLLALAADLALLRWFMIKFQWPGVLYETPFFSSLENGTFFFNSQGDLIISGVFIFLFAFHFRGNFNLFPASLNKKDIGLHQRAFDALTSIGWTIVLLGFTGMTWLFEKILTERESLIEVYKVLTIDISRFADLLFFILILFSFAILVRSIVRQLARYNSPQRFILILAIILVVFIVFIRFWELHPDPAGLVLLLVLIGIYSISAFNGQEHLSHSLSVLIIITGSVFLLQLFYSTNQEKEFLKKRQLLESLADEHDLIAEMLLAGIDIEIKADEELGKLVCNPDMSDSTIQSYLQSNFFGFYWNQYEIQANVCDSVNIVAIIPENREESCLSFFNYTIETMGSAIPGTGFYYIDNFDGLINYRGKYNFYTPDSSYSAHLFISIDSRFLTQELGYPDLLISGSVDRQDSLVQNYSYAKYQEGTLVSRAGNYIYSTNCRNYPEELGRIVAFEEDNHRHLIYKSNPSQTIILSSPRFRLWDHIVSFSYVFVLLYVIWLLVSSLYYFKSRVKRPESGLKQRIQFIMVGILLVSFILTGGGMIYYIIVQYNKTSRNTIAEKTQSVLIEIRHKLNEETYLTPQWSSGAYPSLRDLLLKFSYVFNSDINLYDPQGELLASSRPEVFERKLVGRKMNPVAFHELHVHHKMEFIHFERIGEMKFWSAHVPFYNGLNELVAYLNLPYFAKQSIIRQEISTFVVAILNAYFLLIFITVVLTVLLSNQVTRSLRLLHDKFTKMELGGINETVDYKRKDEIGSLVKSYNRMVEELQASAEKLAKSERETAWREMAKQVAHEIKNPLTPMKLSVQHLQRAKGVKPEDWDSYFDRVSQTLVEQIDSLSAIADEFARFARMPQSRFKAVDLVQKVKSSIDLFELSETGRIRFETEAGGPVMVNVDEEQLQQVFNNLFKNALQSVPRSRKPRILVSLRVDDGWAILSVKDNGTGIDPEVSEKMFEPNFTTKTSGMGLGLAISKNIIEAAGGKIWYETEESNGSTFYISLPLYA